MKNHQQDVDDDNKQKHRTTHTRTQNNNHLRCRQCDYEAEDLSDLLVHRKAHASMKYNHQEFQQEKILSNNSDIENDDDEDNDEKDQNIQLDEQMFNYGIYR